MPFDWREYLNLARFLGGQKNCKYDAEAGLRSAVSRAYYAAFCHARNYAQTNHAFRPTTGGGVHSELIDHYHSRELATIANELDTLRKWRNQCDYDDLINETGFHVLVGSAMRRASRIIEQLKPP
jgi:hypothetical protein